MTITYSAEYERRMTEEYTRTNAALLKELAYSEDLQNKSTIDRYLKHLTKLSKMIKIGKLTGIINL